jgi:hypothetical protein
VLAVGDGAQRYADLLGAVPGVTVVGPGLSWPPAVTLLDLAAAQISAGRAPAEAHTVVPLYMREADAISNFKQVTRA